MALEYKYSKTLLLLILLLLHSVWILENRIEMMMGGRVVTRSLRYPILRRGIRHVALESQSQSSPSPSPSPLESRLRTILRNEIQYQYDYAPPHQAFTEFGKFVVEDLPGQQWITLKAKWGEDENITIEATMFDGSIKDKSDDVRHHITMLVDICRARGNGNSMEFICSALSDSIQIHKVYTFNSHNPQPQPQPYTGPHIK